MDCDTLEASSARLGEELVKARRSRKLSQRSLAAKVGMSRMTIANLEAGRGTVAALVMVLDALGHRFTEQLAELELGAWLVQSRKRLRLSQARLSKQATVSRPAVMRIERGEGTIATMIAAMVALGLPRSLADFAVEATPAPMPVPNARLLHGDSVDHMRHFAEENVFFDAIVTDPPYHLASISRRIGRKQSAPLASGEPGSSNPNRAMATGFLGQEWDGGRVAFDVETWRAAYEVLKPGAHLVAFGGTRTCHRLAIAIEDAGFEIRDQIIWVFGSGFPKSHNLKGNYKGQGTGLKPAHEPILIARKPIAATSVASNLAKFGTGALNIDACRIQPDKSEREAYARHWIRKQSGVASVAMSNPLGAIDLQSYAREGRWPANIVHNGLEETWGRYFYATKASKADRGVGNKHPTVKPTDLMRYLARLVTPSNGTIFDPFAGSGSTGVAAIQEGFSFVGCEQQAEYVEIAERRIAKTMRERSM